MSSGRQLESADALPHRDREMAAKVAELSRLQQELSRQEQELSRLQQGLSRQHQEVSQLQQELSKRDSALSALQQQEGRSHSTQSRLQQDRDEADKERRRLQQEVDNKDRQLSSLQQQVKRREEELSRLQQDLQTRESEVTQLNREKAAKEAELSGLQQDKTKADGEVSRLQQELGEKDRQTKEKEEEVSRLKEHRQTMETEIGRMTSKHLAEVLKLKGKEKRLKESLERKERELRDAMVEMREKVHVLMKDLKQQQSLDHNELVSRVQELQEVDTLIVNSVDSMRTLQASHYNEMTEYRQDLAKAAQSHPDNQALSNNLPQDVQELCHQIQTLIGGNKNKFAKKLLGEKFTESPNAVGFATGKDFWKLMDAWAKSGQEVTRAELEKACEGLHPDPLSTREMSQSDRQRLERHFLLLRERVLISSLVDALRTSGLLTEDARLYLLEDPLPRSQRTARLCDVIVSWGEEGLPALVTALKESDQAHVAIPLKQSQDQELLPRDSTSVEEGQSQTSPRGADASSPQMPEESSQEDEDASRPVSVQDMEKVMEKVTEKVTGKIQEQIRSTVKEEMLTCHKMFDQIHTDMRRGLKLEK